MNRIQFLKRLLTTLFGAAIAKPGRSMPEVLEGGEKAHPDPSSASGSASQTNPPSPKYLLSATVAGTPYYDFPNVGPQLLKNMMSSRSEIPGVEHPAILKLEPDNEFDYKAIEVFWEAHKMGYIPRKHNKALYNLMKDGAELKANIRLQRATNWEEDEVIRNHDFQYAYDLRIRVYLVSDNERSLLG